LHLLVIVAAAVLALWAVSTPKLRASFRQRPGFTAFWVLALVLVALVSFRTGRHWFALVAGAALVWGPRVLALIGAVGQFRKVPGSRPHESPRAARMSRAEALEVLGLSEGVTPREIMERYRALMKNVHPDRGGSGYLAKRVNEAKSILLG
jgi:hypothetical protein